MNTRLYRSRTDRIVAGVCGGLAEILNLDPSIVRILFAILVPLTGGLILFLYLVMAFVVPEQPAGDDRWARWDREAAGPAAADAQAPNAASDAPTAAFAPSRPPSSDASGQRAAQPAADSWRTSTPEPDRGRDSQGWRPEPRGAAAGGGGGALIIGLILVLLGGFFLARSYLPNIDWDRSWPILLVGIGVVLLLGAVRRESPGPR